MNEYNVLNEDEDFYSMTDIDKIDILQTEVEPEIKTKKSKLLIDGLTELSINGYKIIGFVVKR